MAGVDAQGLLQIAMNVKDINRAVAFYRDVLGIPFLFQAGNLAFFDLNGVRLMLDIPENKRFNHPGSPLYLRVADIQAGHAHLVSKGVKMEPGAPHRPQGRLDGSLDDLLRRRRGQPARARLGSPDREVLTRHATSRTVHERQGDHVGRLGDAVGVHDHAQEVGR